MENSPWLPSELSEALEPERSDWSFGEPKAIAAMAVAETEPVVDPTEAGRWLPDSAPADPPEGTESRWLSKPANG